MDEKKKVNITRGLNMVFTKIKNYGRSFIEEKDRVAYMDISMISCIIPKTVEFKQVLVQNYDVHEAKVPVIDYGNTVEDHSVGLSCKYLNILLNIQKGYEYVIVTARRDMPIKFETEDFIFIVAPADEKNIRKKIKGDF